MDAKTNIKARLPSRHVTEGPDRARHHQPFVGVATCWNEVAPCNIALMRQAQVVKRDVGASRGTVRQAPAPYEIRDAFCMTAGEQVAHECGIKFDLLDVAEVFKRTPSIADLKPSGRYVAKDLFEVGDVSLLMKTLLDHGFLHGDCVTVTGRTVSENLKRVTRNGDQDVVRSADLRDGDVITLDAEKGTLDVALSASELDMRAKAWKSRELDVGSGYLWKYAQQVGPARDGAVTHPGGAGEKACYADI